MLEEIGNGIDDYVCCQGYLGKMCCIDTTTMCRGSMLGLVCEGCCCPVLSVSIARIYVMDKKQLHPDPGDYQIIAFSNCLQIIACLCNVLAYIEPSFRELAEIVNIIADVVTATVTGCMTAQLSLEYKDKEGNGLAKNRNPTFAFQAAHYGAPALSIDDVLPENEQPVATLTVTAAEVMER